MHIQEVADILSACRALRAPEHIFITDENVHDDSGGHYRGLQPKKRGDTIFLTVQADETTVPHEAWHAQTGLGELTAYPIGKIFSIKYKFLKKTRLGKRLMNRRKPKYRLASPQETAKEFPGAEKYAGRVRHFVRVK